MVNIAVCDDDTQFAAELENRILSYGKQKAVSLDTEVFFRWRQYSAGNPQWRTV